MGDKKRVVIVVSEGTFDKGMMSMIIANSAASMDMEVHVFFTFFGLNLLKKGNKPKLPGIYRLFTGMFIKRMAKGGIQKMDVQLETAKDLGVNLYACSTTMKLLGIEEKDMIDGIKIMGAAGFLDISADSDMQYFIG